MNIIKQNLNEFLIKTYTKQLELFLNKINEEDLNENEIKQIDKLINELLNGIKIFKKELIEEKK